MNCKEGLQFTAYNPRRTLKTWVTINELSFDDDHCSSIQSFWYTRNSIGGLDGSSRLFSKTIHARLNPSWPEWCCTPPSVLCHGILTTATSPLRCFSISLYAHPFPKRGVAKMLRRSSGTTKKNCSLRTLRKHMIRTYQICFRAQFHL